MDFLDALKLLWRRRLIVLLGILLTGLACGAVITQVKTVYQASAQYLLLLPSEATGESNPQNPLVNQPAGLIIGASLIAAEINTKDTVRDMAADGFESDFALALAPQSGPLLTIQVTDTDPTAAVAQRDEILRRLDEQLAVIQEQDIPDIPDNQIIYSLPAAVNQEADAVPGAKIKALVVVVAVGGLGTLLLAFGLDGALTRRAARRAARTSGGEAAAAPPRQRPTDARAPDERSDRRPTRPDTRPDKRPEKRPAKQPDKRPDKRPVEQPVERRPEPAGTDTSAPRDPDRHEPERVPAKGAATAPARKPTTTTRPDTPPDPVGKDAEPASRRGR